MLTRIALHIVQLALLPVDAAGPSRNRLRLRRARLQLREALAERAA